MFTFLQTMLVIMDQKYTLLVVDSDIHAGWSGGGGVSWHAAAKLLYYCGTC